MTVFRNVSTMFFSLKRRHSVVDILLFFLFVWVYFFQISIVILFFAHVNSLKHESIIEKKEKEKVNITVV